MPGTTPAQKTKWLCSCVCGRSVVVVGGDLKSGRQGSCGCVKIEQCKRRRKHQFSNRKEYVIWENMIRRCYSTKCPAYQDYGGRGISMSDAWRRSFDQFFMDMGSRPSKCHTIERVDNNGPYSKENCVWATWAIQCRNRRSNIRITLNGETKCLSEWCRSFGIAYEYTRVLVRSGVDPLVALTRRAR